MNLLRLTARHGRLMLIAGLAVGFALPGVAQAMKPALPPLVACLVFVSALRIGMRAALGNLRQARRGLWTALLFQLALPLALLAGLGLAGLAGTTVAAVVILATAAPSISGSPAFTVMLGRDPAPAMRLLILGTAVLPLTVLPVFWLMPGFGSPGAIILSALRLTVVIGVATAAGFALRRRFFPDPASETVQALDGLAALTLAVMVVALMSAIGPLLHSDPAALVGWLALALAVNFGAQIAARLAGASVAASVIAGNRNIALFLVALPATVTDPLLVFIGCYQVPMYLTPILMQRYYGQAHA